MRISTQGDQTAGGYATFKTLLTALRNVSAVCYVLQTQSSSEIPGIIVQVFLSGGAVLVSFASPTVPPTFHTDFPDAIEIGPQDTPPFDCEG